VTHVGRCWWQASLPHFTYNIPRLTVRQ
jgi:hypothetical protein